MQTRKSTIGVLAYQGGVIEHVEIIRKLGHTPVEIRNPGELSRCDGLIIPGGESTTIGFFLETTGMDKEITARVEKGMPVFGTCAGAILLAKHIESNIVPPHLGLLDVTIRRNAYGRQVDSFTTELQVPWLGIQDLKTAFIRAPIITKTGPGVEILAKHGEEIVLVRSKNILAATFHPELAGETRLHRAFISLCE